MNDTNRLAWLDGLRAIAVSLVLMGHAKLAFQYQPGVLGWNPQTPCTLLNEGMRLWGHQYVYDEKELQGLMLGCGFGHVALVPWRESAYPELKGLECRPFHEDLIFECIKTAA